jgi:hypothetical protein
MHVPGFTAAAALEHASTSQGYLGRPRVASARAVTPQAGSLCLIQCPQGYYSCDMQCEGRFTRWGSCCARCCRSGQRCDAGCTSSGVAYCYCR